MATPLARLASTLACLAGLASACGGGSIAPLTPVVTVTPGDARVTSTRQASFHATVSDGSTAVAWTVAEAGGGTITPTGLYTAPAGITGETTFHVKAVAASNAEASATVPVNVYPVPEIIRFEAVPAIITAGNGTTLFADFEGGTAVIDPPLDPDPGLIVPGQYDTKPPDSTPYTLTVTNGAGEPLEAVARVQVVAAPFLESPLKVSPLGGVTVGQSVTLQSLASHGTGRLTTSPPVTGFEGVPYSTGMTVGPFTAAGSYDLTVIVTNLAGDTAGSFATVVVGP